MRAIQGYVCSSSCSTGFGTRGGRFFLGSTATAGAAPAAAVPVVAAPPVAALVPVPVAVAMLDVLVPLAGLVLFLTVAAVTLALLPTETLARRPPSALPGGTSPVVVMMDCLRCCGGGGDSSSAASSILGGGSGACASSKPSNQRGNTLKYNVVCCGNESMWSCYLIVHESVALVRRKHAQTEYLQDNNAQAPVVLAHTAHIFVVHLHQGVMLPVVLPGMNTSVE